MTKKTKTKVKKALKIDELAPRELVQELDRYIVGQTAAKKTVAIALRNRVRRSLLDKDLQREITPKNIIMIGSTGVGKTEIARRLSQLSGAPFIKVEATKYTEVGYVGRDVESMVRDLMAAAVNTVRKELQEAVEETARHSAEEQLLELLLPGNQQRSSDNTDQATDTEPSQAQVQAEQESDVSRSGRQNAGESLFPNFEAEAEVEAQKEANGEDKEKTHPNPDNSNAHEKKAEQDPGPEQKVREKFRRMLRAGELDERMVELNQDNKGNSFGGFSFTPGSNANVEIFTNMPEDLGNLGENLQEAFNSMMGGNKRSKPRKVSVSKAREILLQEQREKLVDEEAALELARDRVQNQGIIFIDEIDKIAVREGRSRGGSGEISREGVQRDILPIVEGSQVRTRYGMIDTTHILFIAAGAFNLSKPSDLIPELQGRFPLRVELESLTADSLEAILSTPENSLIFQYTKLLETEGVTLDFRPESLKKLAHIAAEVNASTEDIGARRLHTVLETLLEDISFAAGDHAGQTVVIDEPFVLKKLQGIATDQDLSRYIL
ncbi:ATP-dependent protease ATPase subunit HslU [Candidatus Haliotispira prima]|uniref:ATP-dependent protease ATPase subunit HslU n=1 Tax=Candidatus Haliotispira prima TaxID=3034016 RepID=A0ABY8MF90_9SPIO|nr:ATP-dependent protease ATPase subunit HslU [Candidatus Haliotispira prima]